MQLANSYPEPEPLGCYSLESCWANRRSRRDQDTRTSSASSCCQSNRQDRREEDTAQRCCSPADSNNPATAYTNTAKRPIPTRDSNTKDSTPIRIPNQIPSRIRIRPSQIRSQSIRIRVRRSHSRGRQNQNRARQIPLLQSDCRQAKRMQIAKPETPTRRSGRQTLCCRIACHRRRKFQTLCARKSSQWNDCSRNSTSHATTKSLTIAIQWSRD